jgi:dihydrofolate reductase
MEDVVRTVTAGLFISIDGVIDHLEEWHFGYFNDEMGRAVQAQLGAADTVLFGRKTYESFAGAWPEREMAGGPDQDLARSLGDARKIVASRGAPELAWRNSELLVGDLVKFVAELKTRPGGDIGLSGSVSVVRQLLDAGLIDELHLFVHPVAVRKGTRLFDAAGTTLPQTLLSSQGFETGVLHLVYGPAARAS